MVKAKLTRKLALFVTLVSLFSAIPHVSAVVSNTATQTVAALGNGVTTSYSITFDFRHNSEVSVYLQDESAAPYSRTLLVYGAGAGKYTITGGDPGTTVVMGTAPSSSQRVVIVRTVPLTQAVDYVETEAFPASDHESQMDEITFALQQLNFADSRRPALATASTATVPTFPDPLGKRLLGYNNGGTDLTYYPPSSSTIASGDVLRYDGTNWNNSSALTDHLANTSNPHNVTAAQVGNSTAQWNASKIQGVTVDASNIGDGKALVYDSGSSTLKYRGLISALAQNHIYVGQSTGSPADVAMSGDATIADTGALTIGTVGGSTAANIALAEAAANSATAVNTAGKIVKRDGSGNLAAGTITASLTGNVTGNLTGNVTGNVTGAVTGTATNATNVATTSSSTNASFYPLFVASSSNSNQAASLGTGLTFNPSTNTLATTTFSGALSGNATTATSLAANPSDCAASNFATGIDAQGNLTCSVPAGAGDVTTSFTTTVDSEITLFSGTGGKSLKRATGTGLARVVSGVLGTTVLSHGLQNIGISSSVSANALTINLVQADGSTNCSASAPCIIPFRSSTLTTGSYTDVSVTSSLSITIASTKTIGHVSGVNQYVWVYALNDAGTVDLCVSGINYFNQGLNQSTTQTPANSGTVLYCGSSHTGAKPIRFLGRGISNQVTAGTWAANVSDWQIDPTVTPTITEPVAYTPTFTGFGTGGTSPSSINFISWREGAYLNIQGQFTTGNPTAVEPKITLGYNGTDSPTGVTLDASYSANQIVGNFAPGEASTTFFQVCALATGANAYLSVGAQTSTVSCKTKLTDATVAFGNSHINSLQAKVRINGWSAYGPP